MVDLPYQRSQKQKKMLKLLHILANIETVDGNQSALHNKLLMANKSIIFLVLSSKKNGVDLLCSQTPSRVLKLNYEKWKIRL
jgi:hypothetical protein